MRFILTGLAALFFTAGITAQTHTVFIHGKSDSNHNGVGTTDVNNYWGTSTSGILGSKIFIGYDGTTDPRTYNAARAQTNITTGLTNYCKGANSCKIVCHSAGCYAIGFWLSNLLGTATSKGFNLIKVTALASAAGGSELASAASPFGWFTNAMTESLRVGTARPAYAHNNTGGISIFHVPGSKGAFGPSAILPGEDDGAVAFHSSCGYSVAGSMGLCQPSLVVSGVTYTQYSGHLRAPSLTSSGLYRNHSELKAEGNR